MASEPDVDWRQGPTYAHAFTAGQVVCGTTHMAPLARLSYCPRCVRTLRDEQDDLRAHVATLEAERDAAVDLAQLATELLAASQKGATDG